MLNVEALKEVYVALGGDDDDFTATTNDEAIAMIATVIPSALGDKLPTVTSTENGKVLKVIDGAWGVGNDATE